MGLDLSFVCKVVFLGPADLLLLPPEDEAEAAPRFPLPLPFLFLPLDRERSLLAALSDLWRGAGIATCIMNLLKKWFRLRFDAIECFSECLCDVPLFLVAARAFAHQHRRLGWNLAFVAHAQAPTRQPLVVATHI